MRYSLTKIQPLVSASHPRRETSVAPTDGSDTSYEDLDDCH